MLSAFLAGATAVLAKAGVAGVDPNVATAVRTTIILVIVWGIALSAGSPSEMTAYPARTWVFLSLSAVATGLSWLCYFRALQLGEAARVGSDRRGGSGMGGCQVMTTIRVPYLLRM